MKLKSNSIFFYTNRFGDRVNVFRLLDTSKYFYEGEVIEIKYKDAEAMKRYEHEVYGLPIKQLKTNN